MEYPNHHNQPQLEDHDSLRYTHPPPPPPLRASAFSKPSPPPPPARNGTNTDHDVSNDIASDPITSVKYKECLRNHAAAIGGHVLDGCGEFMADGDTVNSMKCAACGCHRSFHHKETQGENRNNNNHHYYRRDHHQHVPAVPLLLPPPPPTIYKHVLIPPSNNNNSGSGATTESSSEEKQKMQPQMQCHVAGSKKRHRTKFSHVQKERMMGFAERVGWRFQKQDEVAIEEICRELGIGRQVLKVWMHNNKHSIKKQQLQRQEKVQPQLQPETHLQPQLQQSLEM